MVEQNMVDYARKQIESYNEQIKRRDDALKLAQEPLFRQIILEDFCEKACADYVKASVSPGATEENKAHSLAMAQASGYLVQFLDAIVAMGNSAEYNKQKAEEELDAYMRGEYNE